MASPTAAGTGLAAFTFGARIPVVALSVVVGGRYRALTGLLDTGRRVALRRNVLWK